MKTKPKRFLHLAAWTFAVGCGPCFPLQAAEPAPVATTVDAGEDDGACGCDDDETTPAAAVQKTPVATPAAQAAPVVATENTQASAER